MNRLKILLFLWCLAIGLCSYHQFYTEPKVINWNIKDSNLVFQTDNSYDIGISGANRPREIRMYNSYTDSSDYNKLILSGTTDSFPMLKRITNK